MAAAAAPWTVDSDRLAFFHAPNPFADSGDPASVLMAKRERRLEPEVFLHDVQVRVADACATDLD
jgi:hypothetical protein